MNEKKYLKILGKVLLIFSILFLVFGLIYSMILATGDKTYQEIALINLKYVIIGFLIIFYFAINFIRIGEK